MAGVYAYAYPGFVFDSLYDMCQMLELVSYVAALPCRVFYYGGFSFCFFKCYVFFVGPGIEAFFFCFFFLFCSGVGI